jgi:Ser-tRNA(Ala) deacylase AlaX
MTSPAASSGGTELIYLTEMDSVTTSARIVSANDSNLVLDRTIFYPQGGGQPSDQGEIYNDTFRFSVRSVEFSGGVVNHLGSLRGEMPKIGDEAILEINSEMRTHHSRLQTAGHLIVNATEAHRPLRPVKGFHFPEGPYVEFEGKVDEGERSVLLETLQREVEQLVQRDLPVEHRLIDRSELHAICPYVPANLPADKPTRVVVIDGLGQPCGGTHARTTGQLQGLIVAKMKSKKGNVRLYYTLPSALSPYG